MALPLSSFSLFTFLAFLSIVIAQDRPHGIAHENPRAFSPSAFEFFHPKNTQPPSTQNPCGVSSCAPLPVAAQVQASRAFESKVSTPPHKSRGNGMGAGGVAGIVFGFVFVVLMGMGVYYVVITRRDNKSRTNSVQPDV